MSHCLAPFVHYALFGERVVVLDLPRDRYRLLGEPAGSTLAALERGLATDRHAIAQLVDRGVLRPGEGRVGRPIVQPVSTSIFDIPSSATPPSIGARAAAGLIATAIELRVLGLDGTLRRIDRWRERRRISIPDPAETIAMARQYARARQTIPIALACLRDSLALRRLLIGARLPATFVIGVRLDPFLAHSWVQLDDIVLNDERDTVVEFTAIYAL